MAASASGVRIAAPPGPMPTMASRPRARPTLCGSMMSSASEMAQVARADFCLATINWPAAPAAASAAPSLTPWQPTSAKTTSEGLARRGVCASSAAASKNRAGASSASARACTAGSSDLSSSETTQATASADRLLVARVSRTNSINSAGSAPRSQPTPSASTPGCRLTPSSPAHWWVIRMVCDPLSSKAASSPSQEISAAGQSF